MSDDSPAKRHNIAALLGIIFTGIGVGLSLVLSLAAFLAASVSVPDFVGKIANAPPIVGGMVVGCLCVAGIVCGILGMVRAGRLGGAAISLVAIALGAVFLIISALVVGFISLFSGASPSGVF